MREEQRLQEGAAPRDAELAARRQFGNLTALRESCRDLWTFAWLETFVQDLRYGIRQLRRSPGFASVAAITLGVGIGATTAIFSMFDTVMWRSVNLPHPEQFVAVLGTNAANPHFPGAISPAELEEIGRSQSTVAGLAFWTFATSTIVDAGGEPVREESARVSANFFEVVGVQPSMGRAFLPESDREVILSDRLWRGRFAGDPGIIGRAIRVNGRNFTVVAVMPSGFQFPRSWRELWMPLNLTPQERQSRAPLMEAAGRLKPGRTIQQAAAELNAIGRRLEQEHPETNHDRRLAAWPLQRYLFGDYLPVYTAMVLGAAFFVLLIACGNVASLQFARATERWREIAVRAAIGAGRRRLIRQLVTESLVLAVAGAVVGLAGARWGLALVKAGVPAEMRRYMTTWDQIGLNSRAFAFALAAAVASAFLSGLAPAWRSTRANLAGGLKPDGRHKRRLTSALVAGEVALAFVLLMGAGLMVRGFRAMVSGRSDLRPSTLLTLRLTLSESQYRENHQVAGFYRELLARIRSLPGVQSATMVTAMPYSRHATVLPLTVEGAPAGRGPRESAQVQAVDPSYFNTMFLPVRGGRLLNDADGATSPLVTVISERAAKRWWPGAETPVSRRLRLGDSAWITIVGVTGDIPHSVLDREPRPTIYVPFAQSPGRDMNIGIRVAGDPLQLAPAVTAAVRALDPELPVENMATLETLVHQEAFVFAYLAALMGAFGGLALILAVVGVYGVTAHMVAGQTHEIGIRIALGASEGKVLRMLFRRGMTAAVVGMAIGLLPAYGLTRLMAFAMWGVGPAGQAGIQAIPLALAAATAAAIYVPARRALKIDPVAALRE